MTTGALQTTLFLNTAAKAFSTDHIATGDQFHRTTEDFIAECTVKLRHQDCLMDAANL
jgi:hypothetical protein